MKVHRIAVLYSFTTTFTLCSSPIKTPKKTSYEVWGSDQSNSASGQSTAGAQGGFLWIWDSESIEEQLSGGQNAVPLGCMPDSSPGPCNLLDIFPQTLEEYNATGYPTGNILNDLPGFGRIHGVIKDPTNRYVNANLFAHTGGYVGVIDTKTKEAIALFRVTQTKYTKPDSTTVETRSVHMSVWAADGSAILVTNLAGKAIERIDVFRDIDGTITDLKFNAGASIGLGAGMDVVKKASFFVGNNAKGNSLIGSIIGNYDLTSGGAFGDLTPNGVCKESGCGGGNPDPQGGGRSNNVPICPITTTGDNAFVTLGGGGLLVLNIKTTPMQIIGEYGKNVVYGAGCGGVESKKQVFIDSGVSASGAGFDQSTFAVFSFDDTMFPRDGSYNRENHPMPVRIFQDRGNTKTIGNTEGADASNGSGQIPGETTRRDSHGMAIIGEYIHVTDRIQNVVETFDTNTYERNTYDLVSRDGKSGREGPAGMCFTKSVLDGNGLALNDPTPDLAEATPDGKYLMIAFRGPAPISVSHAAQGSCPGVGIVEITNDGKSGKLVDVLRTTNTVDDHIVSGMTGGFNYQGVERSDVHGAIVVSRDPPACPYIAGPRVSNYASWGRRCHWPISGSLTEAQEACNGLSDCTVLHDYGCDGTGWRYCEVSIETLQETYPDTNACTLVVDCSGTETRTGIVTNNQTVTDPETTTVSWLRR